MTRRSGLAIMLVITSLLAGLAGLVNFAGASVPAVSLSTGSGPAGTSITVTFPSACAVPTGPGVAGSAQVYFSSEVLGGQFGFQNYPMNPGDSVTQVTFVVPGDAVPGHSTVTGYCSVLGPVPTFTAYGPALFTVTGASPLPTLTVAPTSGPTGTAIDVSGHCAPAVGQPAASLNVTLFSATDPNVLTSDGVSGTGPVIHVILTVPANFPPGAYFIAASCFDYTSFTTFAEVPFTVQGESPPVAALSVTPSNTMPLAVSADASASTDTDSTPIGAYWFDWGDGTSTGSQPGATASHTYATSGTYVVVVSVRDTAFQTSSAAQEVTVSTGAPGTVTVAGTATPGTVTAGQNALVRFAIANGGSAISGASATVTIPAGLTPVSVTGAGAACGPFTGGQAVCLIGTFAAGANVGLDVVVNVPAVTPSGQAPGIGVVVTGVGIDPAGAVASPTVITLAPGSVQGFVLPGETIATGTTATPADNTIAAFRLPKSGIGAPIELRVETAGTATFCGGKACSGKIVFLSPFAGYTNPRQPARLYLTWDKTVAGRGTKSKIYVQKAVGGPIVRVKDCRNTHKHLADPSPCIHEKERIRGGDIRFEIVLLSGDPRFARR